MKTFMFHGADSEPRDEHMWKVFHTNTESPKMKIQNPNAPKPITFLVSIRCTNGKLNTVILKVYKILIQI
jgi:hypothetical protein